MNGQNPSRFAKIQLTGNANSATATKVNVQEANGEVNTQTINTGFNKNIGLGGSDVVGANTLLNQYSTTPVDWTATTFDSGQVVFYGGKQWIAKMATVAGDVPSVSSKWEEITFEALANKTVIVDDIPTDGSNNAVSSNGVFDALATKAPISSVHNPVTLGTANGLSLATQQLSLGLASSGVTGALSGTDWNTFNNKQPAITGLTTNYLPKWNGSGFGISQILDNGGNVLIGTTIDNGVAKLQVAGTISASPATTANQVPTWGQVQAAARPYKVYTALLTQTGTNAPVATVLENTLGGTVVWTRTGIGIYNATLNGAFTTNKTIIFISQPTYNWYETISWLNTNILNSNTRKAGVLSDDVFSNSSVEIRVYN